MWIDEINNRISILNQIVAYYTLIALIHVPISRATLENFLCLLSLTILPLIEICALMQHQPIIFFVVLYVWKIIRDILVSIDDYFVSSGRGENEN